MKFTRNVLLILLMVASTLSPNPFVSAQEESSESSEHFSMLFMGVDTGDLGRVDQGRSDTMMVMDINKEQETGILARIARDAYVEIESDGVDRSDGNS